MVEADLERAEERAELGEKYVSCLELIKVLHASCTILPRHVFMFCLAEELICQIHNASS